MAANDGEHPVAEIFPGIAVPQGTGAPGSPGATPGPDNWMRVPVVGLYQTSQGDLPSVPLGRDDVNRPGQTTEGFSGQTLDSTGAGEGHVGGPPHPNSYFGRGPQL